MPSVPRKREVWEQARTAEAAWASALAAHYAAVPGSEGLRQRLEASAEAARAMAAVADRATAVGLEWAAVPDAEPASDVLRGELATKHRWLCTEWVEVERAERRAAAAARTGPLAELTQAFKGLSEAFDALASVADQPHGPTIGDTSTAR